MMNPLGMAVVGAGAIAMLAGCPLPPRDGVQPAPGRWSPVTEVRGEVTRYGRIELIEPTTPLGEAVPPDVLDTLSRALATELSGVSGIQEVRTSMAPLATAPDVLRVTARLIDYRPPPSDAPPGGRMALRVALHNASTNDPMGEVLVRSQGGRSIESLCAGLARATADWLTAQR